MNRGSQEPWEATRMSQLAPLCLVWCQILWVVELCCVLRCQCDIILQCIAAISVSVAVCNNSSKTAMKRCSGSGAWRTDGAADSSAEQPAHHSVDDNKKRRKPDEQRKSASDAHPRDIALAGATSTWQGDIHFLRSAEQPASSFRPNAKVDAATAHKQIRGSASSAAQPASDSTAAELPFAISTPCETQARRF